MRPPGTIAGGARCKTRYFGGVGEEWEGGGGKYKQKQKHLIYHLAKMGVPALASFQSFPALDFCFLSYTSYVPILKFFLGFFFCSM